MRVAMIYAAPVPPQEGIGYYVKYLSQYLLEQGHQVTLITRGDMRPTWCKVVENIPVWHVTFLPTYPYHVQLHNLFVQRLIQKLEEDLDIIHLHSPLVTLPKTTLPTLVTIHSLVKPRTEKMSIKTWHGLSIKLQTPFSIEIEKKLFTRSNRIVTTSTSVANELLLYGIDPALARVIGNGVDTKIFGHRTRQKVNKPPYFFTAGRLVPDKGVEDLLESACLVLQIRPDIQFLIAGSGPSEHKLKTLIQRLDLSRNVFLIGQVSDRSRMAELYSEAIAYVHPTYYEGLPTVILEAMSCGKAVISTRVSGSIDLITDEVNGILVEPRQPAALTQAILRVLDHPEVALRLGSAARKTVLEKYSWPLVGDRYIEEYRAIIERKR